MVEPVVDPAVHHVTSLVPPAEVVAVSVVPGDHPAHQVGVVVGRGRVVEVPAPSADASVAPAPRAVGGGVGGRGPRGVGGVGRVWGGKAVVAAAAAGGGVGGGRGRRGKGGRRGWWARRGGAKVLGELAQTWN